MKKKYFLFLIFVTIILTGCSANYKINVDNTIKEDISLIETNVTALDTYNNDYGDTIRNVFINYGNRYLPLYTNYEDLYDYSKKLNGIKYYNQSLIKSNSNVVGIKYNYNFGNDYADSYFANLCFDSFKYIRSEKQIIISTSDNFKCFNIYNNLDNIKVIIDVGDNYVLKNNADSNDNSQFVWNFSKQDYKKNVFIEIELSQKINNQINTNNKIDVSNNANYFIIGALIIAVIIVFLVLYLKQKKNNRM